MVLKPTTDKDSWGKLVIKSAASVPFNLRGAVWVFFLLSMKADTRESHYHPFST